MKNYLLVFFVCMFIGAGTYLYIAFYGLPWKKTKVANELEQYVEEKYEIDVTLQAKYFNFKDGSYGAEFVLNSDPSITFLSEQYRNGNMSDYLPESVWVKEVLTDVTPVLEDVFQHLTIETADAHPVYGMGNELVKGKDIPSYKEKLTSVDYAIHFNDAWNDDSQNILMKEGYAFISKLQENGAKNLGIRLYLQEKPLEGDQTQTFSISIEGTDFNYIKSEKDLEKYISIF